MKDREIFRGETHGSNLLKPLEHINLFVALVSYSNGKLVFAKRVGRIRVSWGIQETGFGVHGTVLQLRSHLSGTHATVRESLMKSPSLVHCCILVKMWIPTHT